MRKLNIEVLVKFILIVLFIGLLLLIVKESEKMSTEQPTQKIIQKPITKVLSEQKYVALPENLNSDNSTQKATEETKIKMDPDYEQYLAWKSEYYYATKVWEYFMQRDYGRAIISAILGNMMIETSGGTLDLKPTVYSPSRNYYGLCQWSLKYYPEARGLTFEQQLDYLLKTMPWEFNTFGWLYKEGFDFEEFIQMDDPEEAALAFAKVYERCGPASYNLRQQAARKAYNYFKHSK